MKWLIPSGYKVVGSWWGWWLAMGMRGRWGEEGGGEGWMDGRSEER